MSDRVPCDDVMVIGVVVVWEHPLTTHTDTQLKVVKAEDVEFDIGIVTPNVHFSFVFRFSYHTLVLSI